MSQVAKVNKDPENYRRKKKRSQKKPYEKEIKIIKEIKTEKQICYISLDQFKNAAEIAKSEYVGTNEKSSKEKSLSDLKNKEKILTSLDEKVMKVLEDLSTKGKEKKKKKLKRLKIKDSNVDNIRGKKIKEKKKKLGLVENSKREKEEHMLEISHEKNGKTSQENTEVVGNRENVEEKIKLRKKGKTEGEKKKRKKSKELKFEIKKKEESIILETKGNTETKNMDNNENIGVKVDEASNIKILSRKEEKMIKKERRKKGKGLKSKEKKSLPLEIIENERAEIKDKDKTKKRKKKIKKSLKEKIEDNKETNTGNSLTGDLEVKTEPLDFFNSDLTKTDTEDLNHIECFEDLMKKEPDVANGSGPEKFLNTLGKTIDEMIFQSAYQSTYQLEPGEAVFKREPDSVEKEIKKEVVDETEVIDISENEDNVKDVLKENKNEEILNKNEKKEYLICFRNLLKGSEEQKIKELSFMVLEPQQILDIFLVNERKKRFGFLKVSSKLAVEKVLSLNGWAVDGRYIRVTESDLINVKKDPPKLSSLTLTPPSETKKRKREEDLDSNLIKETMIEKGTLNNHLSKVEENVKVDDNKEGKLCQRCTAFLGNMNYSTTDEQIRIFLESIVAPNKILRVRRVQNRSNRTCIGFVDLADKESLERVLKLGGSKLMGRTVRVEVCGESSKKRKTDRSEETLNTEENVEDSNSVVKKRSRDFSKKPKVKKFKKN